MVKENIVKWSLATLTGGISAWTGHALPLIFMVIAALLIDYITGMLAAAYNGELSSKKGGRGIIKKSALLFLLFLGFFLDAAIPYLVGRGLDADIPAQLPFGLIIAAWIVLNEAVSTLENLHRIDGVRVPKFLGKWLKSAQDGLDE